MRIISYIITSNVFYFYIHILSYYNLSKQKRTREFLKKYINTFNYIRITTFAILLTNNLFFCLKDDGGGVIYS